MAARKPLTRTSGRVTELLAADNIDAGSKKITSVANGTAAQDAAAFGQLPTLPLTTDGDLLTRASSANARLAIGATASSLRVSSGLPFWLQDVFPYVASRDYNSLIMGDTINTNDSALIVVNKKYAHPIVVPPGAPDLAGLAVRVRTGAASTNARLAIYSDNGSFAPGALLKDAGVVSTVTSGTRVAATFTPISLPPGLYWLACVSDGAPTLQGFGWDKAAVIQNKIFGSNQSAANKSGAYVGGYDTFTYGAWADPYGTCTFVINSAATMPIVYLVF